MAIQNILVLVGIVSFFAAFGIILAWGDFYSSRAPRVDDAAPVADAYDPKPSDERRAA